METAVLTLETLHKIPGLAEDFNAQVEQIIADCKKRPGVSKKRVVKVEIEIKPHGEDAEDVYISPVISSKRPSTVIDTIRGRCTKRNQLMFDFGDEANEE